MNTLIVTPQPDLNTIARAVKILFADEPLVELRVLSPGHVERGYYTNWKS